MSSARIVAFGVVVALSQQFLFLSLNVVALGSSILSESSNAARSFVELYSPKINTDIVLLGCLHGSLSSSIDVKQVLLGEATTTADKIEQEENSDGESTAMVTRTAPHKDSDCFPNFVILELCEPRYQDILDSRSELIDDYDRYDFWKDLTSYWGRTLRDNGLALALFKIVLGTASVVQTNLSGIRAGLEFEVALDIVEEHNENSEHDKNNIRLVLGDRNINETMERIRSLPSVSLELLSGKISHKSDDNWQSPWPSIRQESDRLWASVFGNTELPSATQVSMPRVLVRNEQARNDLGRLLFVPAVLITLSTLFLAFVLNGFEPDPYDVLLWETLTSPPWSKQFDPATSGQALGTLAANSVGDFLALLIGYVILALPASKVIVSERDDVLTKSILETLEHTDAAVGPKPRRRRLVAVLGLLHVNGVAQQLVEHGCRCGCSPCDTDHHHI